MCAHSFPSHWHSPHQCDMYPWQFHGTLGPTLKHAHYYRRLGVFSTAFLAIYGRWSTKSHWEKPHPSLNCWWLKSKRRVRKKDEGHICNFGIFYSSCSPFHGCTPLIKDISARVGIYVCNHAKYIPRLAEIYLVNIYVCSPAKYIPSTICRVSSCLISTISCIDIEWWSMLIRQEETLRCTSSISNHKTFWVFLINSCYYTLV